MSVKTVTHRFNVWITVPAVSGDGWSQYPDYSAGEMGRMIRRALCDYGYTSQSIRDKIALVEHAETDDLP